MVGYYVIANKSLLQKFIFVFRDVSLCLLWLFYVTTNEWVPRCKWPKKKAETCNRIYVVGSKSFRPDHLSKVTEIKQLQDIFNIIPSLHLLSGSFPSRFTTKSMYTCSFRRRATCRFRHIHLNRIIRIVNGKKSKPWHFSLYSYVQSPLIYSVLCINTCM